MTKLSTLYGAFFRIGLMMFGGAYSMLPLLEREVVDRYRWVTREELLDYFAISQCTPGIISVNAATLIGYNERGFRGSLCATLGVITPAIIIITVIASVLSGFAEIPAVIHAFAGIRVAVAALILSAVVKLFKDNVLRKPKDNDGVKAAIAVNAVPVILCLLAFVLVAVFGSSPVYVVVGAAAAGLLMYGRRMPS